MMALRLQLQLQTQCHPAHEENGQKTFFSKQLFIINFTKNESLQNVDRML